MYRPLLVGVVSLLVLAGWTAAANAQPTPDQLAQKAKAVLRTHCYRCHGDGGRAEAGMFVLNYRKLIDTKKIVPNNLKGSKVYKRLALDGDMPPETTDDGKPIPRPGPDDVAAIKAWIEAGAPDFAGAAAPDGETLVGWAGGWAGAQMAFFRNGIQSGSDDKIAFSMGLFALPSADGRRLFTPDALINRDGGAVKVAELSNAYPVPAHEPGFFVALHSQGHYPGASFDKGPTANLPAVSQVAVYTDDGQRLFTVAGIDGLKAGAGLFWERRVHYYPRAGLLAVLVAPDRLLLRRVDLVKQLEKTGADYVVVVSRPPAARCGSTWSYQLDARAKAGPVKAKLEAGPEGLTVTPEGRVTWRVPEDYSAPVATVKLSDANGQEVLHQFSAAVAPAKD
jgi:mono/diheme cytochrome c family protein